MNDLIGDTLIWFAGFIAVSVTLLMIARKLMQRARSYGAIYKKLISKADVASTTESLTDNVFATGLDLLVKSSSQESSPSERQLLERMIRVQEPHSRIVNGVVLVACGSFGGGMMWSLTSDPRSWYGLMIGVGVAIAALSLGMWLHSRATVSHSPPLRMSWANFLEILSLRWETAGPQTEMIHKTALVFAETDPELSAFIAQSASIPFDESPFWSLLSKAYGKPWPMTPAEQTCLLREVACRIRHGLSQAMRSESQRLARSMKVAIWLFLAPALYLVVLTPPIVELALYLQTQSDSKTGGSSRVAGGSASVHASPEPGSHDHDR
ncbi:MAG: hypothetical protein ACKVT0_12525 [Planctomycetaceae bacterium]